MFSVAAMFSACNLLDNYEEPQETIYGTIIDKNTGKPLQCEAGDGGVRIKLMEYSWSDDPTPYYFNARQDGTYRNTKIFEGNYGVSAEGPFVEMVKYGDNGVVIRDESRNVDIKGDVEVNFEVEPFLNVEWVGEPFIDTDGTITAAIRVKRGTDHYDYQQDVTDICLFVAFTPYVGDNNYLLQNSMKRSYSDGSGNDNLGKVLIFKSQGELISGRPYYVRAGARIGCSISGRTRYNYTEIKEINVP